MSPRRTALLFAVIAIAACSGSAIVGETGSSTGTGSGSGGAHSSSTSTTSSETGGHGGVSVTTSSTTTSSTTTSTTQDTGSSSGAPVPDGGFDACAVEPCVPQTCADQGTGPMPPPEGAPADCAFAFPWGPIPDGCGNVIVCGTFDCGSCAPLPGCCGVVTDPPGAAYVDDGCGVVCTPRDCTQLGCCGPTSDGCGNSLDCGPCGAADAGPPCSDCVPKTCAELGYECGNQGDGCGGMIDCGQCDPCVRCDQGTCAGTYVGPCVPKTCVDQGVECGQVADGCCNVLDCGSCPSPLACSAGRCLPVCM